MLNATRICLCALLLTAASADAEELYRWVDADGQVHFGDRPPQSAKAEDIEDKLRPINSADAPTPHKAASGTQQANLQQQYESRQRQQAQQQRRQVAQACRKAQRDLHILQGRVMFVDANGKEVKITERERQQRAAELQREISRVCG
ncbi:DUF4124 domain-containing protein [Microbulbifer hainanensis]|uniref:DUF4124 domain-containing protein n=1 Tax=Microbulbifer hainanensis TaxID=2735675 RepID=UPI0018683640|nr:DUF4124 domain-containing protein [Microbulbifer hainanensis]